VVASTRKTVVREAAGSADAKEGEENIARRGLRRGRRTGRDVV
jgi:hypothetical protein